MTESSLGVSARQRIGVRALGFVGMLGGLALVAVFLVDIPASANTARLVAYLVGGIAVAMGVLARTGRPARPLARAGTVPVVLANSAGIAWILLALGRERPFAGDFGLMGFGIALVWWLAAAWFGLVAFRLASPWRWAGVLLAVGSILAIAGMDRLGLTSATEPTIFGSIALAGVALNGLAWIALGLDLALHPMDESGPWVSAEVPAPAA